MGAPVLGQPLQRCVSCRRLGKRAAPNSESQAPVTSECDADLTATQCSLTITMTAVLSSRQTSPDSIQSALSTRGRFYSIGRRGATEDDILGDAALE